MIRHTLFVFLMVVLFTIIQGFSWGHVFNNEKNRNRSKEGDGLKPDLSEIRSGIVHAETEDAERPLPESLHEEKEKSFRAAKSEEVHEEGKGEGMFEEKKSVHSKEKKSRRGDETASAGSARSEEKKENDGELRLLEKEVLDIKRPLGPETRPERVEVVGVPREREHHITDGLADAIAGLMDVYNSLVRSDGRDFEASTHIPVYRENDVRRDDTKSTAGEKTVNESVHVKDMEVVKKGGWGPMGVLAGIVLVAGVGLLLVGFRQRERESPVYPPRGPAYV